MVNGGCHNDKEMGLLGRLMNYAAHYYRLTERARHRVLIDYKERHHIKPRCMGGGDSKKNVVELTPEEHYVAHQLLVKLYPDVKGLAWAAVKMAKQCTGNKAYGWLRRRHAIAVSEMMFGKSLSLEHRTKIGTSNLGKKRTKQARRKMSASARRRCSSPEEIQRMSERRLKYMASTEGLALRMRISKAQRGRKCSKKEIEARARRWQGDNNPMRRPGTAAKGWITRRLNMEIKRREL